MIKILCTNISCKKVRILSHMGLEPILKVKKILFVRETTELFKVSLRKLANCDERINEHCYNSFFPVT